MKKYVGLCVIAGILFFSCKKKSTEPTAPAQPQLKWQYTGIDILNSPAIGPDGTIYVFAENDTLYAFDPNGSIKWKFGIPDTMWLYPSNIFSSPVVAQNGTIYIFAVDGYLYSINPGGSLNWKYAVGGILGGGTPAIGSDGTIYIYAPDSLFAITPSGTRKWATYVNGGSCITFPAIGSDGTVYIGADAYLFALNSDGSVKWSLNMAPAIDIGDRLAIASDGTVYVLGQGGVNDALNLVAIGSDGTVKWTYTVADSNALFFGSPVTGTDGTIYFAGNENFTQGYTYAVSSDGSLKWKVESSVTYGQQAGGYSIDSDGIIYTMDEALNPDGTVNWEYPPGQNPVLSLSSPAIGPDGTIYFGATNGLFAFEGSSSGLAPSSWPRAHHDNRNSGNISGQ